MTKVQHILKKIDELGDHDREVLLREILKRIDKKERIMSILSKYQGVGKGIWNTGAQKYVNSERSQDRV